MMTDSLHALQTEAFINENPIVVSCMRAPMEATGNGGFRKGAVVDSGARTVRLVGQRSPQSRTSPDGRNYDIQVVAMAMPDDDWQEGDTFTHEGLTYEIVFINAMPPWRKHMELIVRG